MSSVTSPRSTDASMRHWTKVVCDIFPYYFTSSTTNLHVLHHSSDMLPCWTKRSTLVRKRANEKLPKIRSIYFLDSLSIPTLQIWQFWNNFSMPSECFLLCDQPLSKNKSFQKSFALYLKWFSKNLLEINWQEMRQRWTSWNLKYSHDTVYWPLPSWQSWKSDCIWRVATVFNWTFLRKAINFLYNQ